jgi:hypothetical protein
MIVVWFFADSACSPRTSLKYLSYRKDFKATPALLDGGADHLVEIFGRDL